MASGMVVSASMGVMKPLLTKLTVLMGDEYKKLKGVRKQVSFLKDELTTMSAFLEKLAFMDDDGGELDPLVKDWRNHVREMTYDIEDCIDDFMHQLGGGADASGFLQKTARRLKTLRVRHQIANQIDEIKARVIEANQRRRRYELDGCSNSRASESVAIDPRLTALYQKADNLVGIDGPTEELIQLLTDAEQQKLMVVSIVGFGGLGKTTLAKQVYDKIGQQFDCKAFVSVSQRPDIARLLRTIQSKFNIQESSQAREVQDIIDDIRYYLGNKRVFGFEDGCPSQYEKVSAEILKKCGNLPLAIITIASLLACRPARIMQEWERIRNSLGTPFGTNPSLEGMRQILNLSYKNLPLHLRTCLLYLGNYPEDYEITRDDVVRQWIAEGFVRSSPGQDLEDVGQSYFNELVNRGLIQPEQNYDREVTGFRVHDMMLDLILSKCKEDNFISVAYSGEDYLSIARQHGYSSNKVRRLSLQFKAAESDCTVLIEGKATPAHLAQVRSISLFEKSTSGLPLLLRFKYLRVLHIMLGDGCERADLTAVSKLLQLRCLIFLGYGCKVELPSRICGLVHLETLEIACNVITSIPLDIVSLPCLSDLMLPSGVQLNCLPNSKSLRTLGICPPLDMDFFKALGEQTNLRDLRLYFDGKESSTASNLDSLGSSVGKLQNLRYLEIYFQFGISGDSLMGSLSRFPRSIEILDMQSCYLSRVPRWINVALVNLRRLHLSVSEASTDEVSILGELPSLVFLNLNLMLKSKGTIMFGGGEGSFPALEDLLLRCVGDSRLCFLAGVMPKLQRLVLRFWYCELGIDTAPVGMEHLSSLQLIDVYIYHLLEKKNVSPRDAVEHVFRQAAQAHPNQPAFVFYCTGD
nr:putative rice blast resistance protein [Oryza sativa Indica Group]